LPNDPSVLWLRIGNTTNVALYAHIGPVLPDIVEALEIGERVIEVR
jgi:predicted nuclease of predicted toxin-antitoxin system